MSKEDEVHPVTELMLMAAKAGISLLPAGGLITAGLEAVRLLSQQAAKQMEQRTEARFSEFISCVFNGEVSPEVTEFLTVDDYHALLSGCVTDMENEKAKYYGRLAAAIGKGLVTGSARRYMILTLTQLSEAQLQMLRRSLIAVQYKMRPVQGSGNLEGEELLQLSDAVHELEYKDLQAKSLYADGKLTQLAADFVRACFVCEELTPESIGQVRWYPRYLDMVFDSNEGDLIIALGRKCWLNAVHASNRHVSTLDRGLFVPAISPRVMIMRRGGTPDYLPNLTQYLKADDVLFVTYHDYEKLIRQYYPSSEIIDASGQSAEEVAERVMVKIKAIIEA
ncbi:hypothetical protein ACM78Z_26910 [Pseudomonas aeruginosa]